MCSDPIDRPRNHTRHPDFGIAADGKALYGIRDGPRGDSLRGFHQEAVLQPAVGRGGITGCGPRAPRCRRSSNARFDAGLACLRAVLLLQRSQIGHDIVGLFRRHAVDRLHFSLTIEDDLLQLGIRSGLDLFGSQRPLGDGNSLPMTVVLNWAGGTGTPAYLHLIWASHRRREPRNRVSRAGSGLDVQGIPGEAAAGVIEWLVRHTA